VITFNRIAWVSRVGVVGVLGLLGAGVGLAGCEVPPEESDMEELFSEEPEASEEAIPPCGPSVPPGTCCMGTYSPANCRLQPSPDTWGYLPAEGSNAYYVRTSYGNTSCEDSYVIGYQEPAIEDSHWLKEVNVVVPPLYAPTSSCACSNTVVMLEWEDALCDYGPGVAGSCCYGNTCSGSCMTAADCDEDWSCEGATPNTTPMCFFGTQIVRKSKAGVWGPNGCTVSVTMTPEEASGDYFFSATTPQLRATAMDRRTGVELPITVRTSRH
jgi:hypothetical protein